MVKIVPEIENNKLLFSFGLWFSGLGHVEINAWGAKVLGLGPIHLNYVFLTFVEQIFRAETVISDRSMKF